MADKRGQAPGPPGSPGKDEAAPAPSAHALRRLAEARLRDRASPTPASIDSLSPEQARHMLHELQVHQIELEMQNEELRDAHVALDVERARYFDLYDLAPVGYCTVCDDGLIKQANLTLASLLGTTRGALIRQRWHRFIAREDADLYHRLHKRLLETGEPQSGELRMVRKDGTPFWGQWEATIAPDVHGSPEMRAVLSDVTVRKRAEQALVERSEQYQNLFTTMGEGFCVIDMIFDEDGKPVDYRFVELNPSFERQTGLHQAMGKRARELVPDLETHWYETYGRVALTGEPVRILDHARAMEGRWFDVHAYRLGGPGSHRVAILFEDSTERINGEIKLREAKHAADKANRAKSEFLSNMSHELRTPLNAILGFAQLIDSGSPPPTASQKRSADHILKAGWYLLALVDDILDLAVIESGTLSLTMQAVPLDEVLRECQAMVEQQARSRGIRLSFPRFQAPCHLDADRTRLKQVLSNLLSNAIKYNRPEGSVHVDWRVTPAGRVRISVADTGDGLPEEKIAQLFQPFNRLGKESGPEQGTGIGLVVSKRVVEMMGGTIGVQSTLGEGCVFWIELRPATLPTPVAARAAAGLAPGGLDAEVHTLLYVEDNPANLALVQEILSSRPEFRLLTATDGESGVAMARAALPHVVLMDVSLPGISGTEAMKILARDPATTHIPVVALSANATAIDVERGLQTGFFRYLTKPIKIDELMATLATALEFSASQGKPPTTRQSP
ncbi:MAG: response regulator [Arenimonas sp.]|uniref:hybrid sensor histidine kinase/response regulator n=1 Tax=Arenimonas sp. TaxID=1872635 RepID=UPI0025BDCAE3|nr:PAS domain-containing hybrid sensor histidine kinase/response regulator [Arenimonas sp.]MBW8368982.1 response regulator [Arenimonas sp.]